MDELIETVNNKQKQREEAARNRRKREDCKTIYKVSGKIGFGLLILASYWIPVLAVAAAIPLFAEALLVADRHLRNREVI